MLRLQIAAPAAQREQAQRALLRASNLTIDASGVLLTCLMPGAPSPHEPPGLRPIAVPLWIATRDGKLIGTPRETGALPRLIADLDALAHADAWRALWVEQAPPVAEARITIEQAGAALPNDTALQVGARYEFRVQNTASTARYLTLIEIGSDQQVRQLVPHPRHVDPTPQRIEPGQSLAVAADYYARDEQFAAVVDGGLPAAFPDRHPWTPDAPATMTLRAILTATPLHLELDAPPPVIEAGDIATLEVALEGEPPPPEESDDEREISPTGSGYVLIYWVELLDGTVLGHLGVTSTTGMKHLNPSEGYWNWFPKKEEPWPDAFRLRGETVGQHETMVLTQFAGAKRLTNPTFSTKAVTIGSPPGMTQSWKIIHGTDLVGYMARAEEHLYWYSTKQRDYLPMGTLTFTPASLPTSGDFHPATDVPLN